MGTSVESPEKVKELLLAMQRELQADIWRVIMKNEYGWSNTLCEKIK